MIFFTGLLIGAVIGAAAYRYFYTLECYDTEVVCSDGEKEKEIQKQMERLIVFGNDL
jgi:hypothetical protein